MKQTSKYSSFAQPLRRLRFSALAGAALTLWGTAMAFDPNATCPSVSNPASKFPVTVDGIFTPNSTVGTTATLNTASAITPGDEWSDVTPQVFKPDPMTGALERTCPGNPDATSYVYTSLDPGEGGVPDALYLMYDFVGDHNDPSRFLPGEQLAQVQFGVHLPAFDPNNPNSFNFGGTPDASGNTTIIVRFVSANPVGIPTATVVAGGAGPRTQIPVDVVFDVDGPTGAKNVSASTLQSLGLVFEGAASFGTSPNDPNNAHLQAELGVGLRIQRNTGPALGGGNGINPDTGLYDPNPKFWGSGFNDPSGGGSVGATVAAALVSKAAASVPGFHAASANQVTINPDGSVFVNSGADAGTGFVPFDAADARSMALDKLKGLRAAATDRKVQRALDEIISDQMAASNPALYTDAARLKPRGGDRVFDLDEDTIQDLSQLIRRVPALASALQPCLDLLIGLDGEFARVAIRDALAALPNPTVVPWFITEALGDVAAGDKAAAANRNGRAVDYYEDAWEDVTRPRRLRW